MAPRVHHYPQRSGFPAVGSPGIGTILNAVAALIVVVWALGMRGEAASPLASAFASSPVAASGASGANDLGLEAAPREAAAQPAVSFVAQASGTVLSDADVFARPGGGAIIGSLRAGMAVEAGGFVRVSGGLMSRRVLWIRGESASAVVYGFVAEEAIQVTAGMPLEIDVRGIPSEQFLAPAPGAVYSGGENVSDAATESPAQTASISKGNASPAFDSTASAASVPMQGQPQLPSMQAMAQDQSPTTLVGRLLQGVFGVESKLQASASESAVIGGSGVAWMPDSIERWMPQIEAASRAHGVDVKLIAIVTLVESGGNPMAQSPSGAMGLMQIMPATGQDIARIRGIQGFELDQLWDEETNIDFGAWYLAQQLSAFGVEGDLDWQQSVELAASAYNGGPGTVQAMLGSGRALPNETERYRAWVGGMWNERSAEQSATFETWWWAGGSHLVESAREHLALR